jgi:hypothetical protein
MIIGTIRFLHLSPREGGTIERHFGLSARHFSLAPAGYNYRQQGTKTGREPKRDRNQFGTETYSGRGPTGTGNQSPPGPLRQRGTIRLGAATVARSRRPKIEVELRYTAATRQGNKRQREPISARGTKGNGNHRQGEPKATGTKGNGNHDFSSSTSRLFPLPYFLGALKPASVVTPYGDQLNFKSCRLPKRGDSPGPGPLLERCPGFLDSPAQW